MKKVLLTAAFAALSVPALAADLPRRSAAPTPVYAAPIFTWSGFYVGAQLGYAWGKDKFSVLTPVVDSFSTSPAGLLGGVHAGYNWQTGSIVLGVEADLELANARDNLARTIGGTALVLGSRIGTQGSLRLRAGYAFDRTLLYVTGGVAGASIKESVIAAGVKTSTSGTEYGYTLGAGVEYAITNNISARAEYRFTDFGKSNYAGTVGGGVGAVTANFKTTDHAVRVGVSYRFGGMGPVVARY
ncbi:MAG: Autotransporter outer rane beta-barrel protein [Hyphomicrobiales bacterium]|nr:Autotransporter outer rane beta-barrel protein [Hyphomicrobiales bacterium]